MVDMEPGQAVESCDPKESVPLPTIAGRDMPLTALTFRYGGEMHNALLGMHTYVLCVHEGGTCGCVHVQR